MAQLNSIICTGPIRALGTINGSNINCTDTIFGQSIYSNYEYVGVRLIVGNETSGGVSANYNAGNGLVNIGNNTNALSIYSSDLVFNGSSAGTWDGTNTSLKSALATASGKVTQTSTTTSANYEVLFSGTADDTTRTEGARKSSTFIFNPSKKGIIVGDLATNTSLGSHANAFGTDVTASGNYSHAEGDSTTASGQNSHAEGVYTIANHKSQYVFGEFNIEDTSTAAAASRGNYVEIVGNGTSSNARSNARTLDWSGNEWIAGTLVVGTLRSGTTLGTNASAFGINVTASGNYSHAEGSSTQANGKYSHAEGSGTKASGNSSHAEGEMTKASNFCSHAEGYGAIASGHYSHAEGLGSTASGYYSHAEGNDSVASHKSQHVFGEYNIEDPSTAAADTRGNYVEIVGNGTSASAKSNARTLNWNGNEWIKGTLTQGSSIEIKKNVADMTQEDGDKILNLRPVVFDYKSSEKDVQAERGFIAEEVKEVIPNLVTDKIVNDEGETVAPASLNYIAMIPYLVKVCQRQQKEIDDLKAALKSK